VKITQIAGSALVVISFATFAGEPLSAADAHNLALQTQKYLPLAEKKYKEVVATRSLPDAQKLLRDTRELMGKWVDGVGDETINYNGCSRALVDLQNMIQYTIDGKRTDAEMAVFKDDVRTFYENMEGCDRGITYSEENGRARR